LDLAALENGLMAFLPLAPLAGGALIGLSASALLVLNGRVAGVSGILAGLFQARRGEIGWRLAFLGGLLTGGLLLAWRAPQVIAPHPQAPPLLVVLAGLLVGFGTQLGGGCTSGHGVCGVSRASGRSIVAVLAFMATGMLATFFVAHVLGRRG
jgi:uncharacterized membrane protein YedE/YeeE